MELSGFMNEENYGSDMTLLDAWVKMIIHPTLVKIGFEIAGPRKAYRFENKRLYKFCIDKTRKDFRDVTGWPENSFFAAIVPFYSFLVDAEASYDRQNLPKRWPSFGQLTCMNPMDVSAYNTRRDNPAEMERRDLWCFSETEESVVETVMNLNAFIAENAGRYIEDSAHDYMRRFMDFVGTDERQVADYIKSASLDGALSNILRIIKTARHLNETEIVDRYEIIYRSLVPAQSARG